MMLNNFYSPYAHLAYYRPSYVHNGDGSRYQDSELLHRQRQRAEAIAAQRARRAQYLPLEDVDDEEEYSFGPFGRRERQYVEAVENENERRRREAEGQRYQQWLEELRRREAARIHQAAELERNRREQARRSQDHVSPELVP
jgi:hypothetical protein